MLIDVPVLYRDSDTEKQRPSHHPFYYVFSMIWKFIACGVIIWLVIMGLIRNVLAGRSSPHHRLKPMSFGLSVFYILVLVLTLIPLLCSALMDCREICRAIINCIATTNSPTTNHEAMSVVQQVWSYNCILFFNTNKY